MSIKCVAYTSKLSIDLTDKNYSSEIIKIVNKSRINNKNLGVTGILLFSGSHVFQYLEGDNDTIATLLYRIKKDSRHQFHSLALHKTGDKRLFPTWNMRLISPNTASQRKVIGKICDHYKVVLDLDGFQLEDELVKGTPSPVVVPLLQSHAQNVQKDSQQKKQALKPTSKVPFEGYLLELKSWPRPRTLNENKGILQLCSALSAKPCTLNHLRAQSIYSHDEDLINALNLLDRLNFLIRTQDKSQLGQEPLQLNTKIKKNNDVKNRFSQAIKRFIHSAKLGS